MDIGRGADDIVGANATPSLSRAVGLGGLIAPQPHLKDGSTYRAPWPT